MFSDGFKLPLLSFWHNNIINVVNIIKQINVTTGVLFIAILTTFFSYKKKRPKHRHIKLDNEFVKPLVIFYSLHPSPFNGKNRDAPVWEEICKYGSLFRFYWIWCFHHRVRKPSPTRNKIHSFIVKVDFEDNPCATVSNSLTCFNLVLHLLQTPNIWLAGRLNN